MAEINIEKMKERLLAEKAELEGELARHGHKGRGGDWTGASDDYGAVSADKNEVADQIEDLVTSIPLVEGLENHYNDVLVALDKIEKGTYGVCEVGGKKIPAERLEANPSARTCVNHTS
ncbi:hypothetical protein COU13_01160 [Candidatus Kaiserbacteria bacterium CG10_big_fil_rev_8_21_14_0_10_43_70]|uniref:Zinc finger DksA/TraR C4-type domain-containing protein n=1 Tax=Candidatus Kaiserbacteria bacterium CG10_big_fil_rev_8_21_14_0_10_43_70 TaxID=1974605 RepID=A0A2H0UJ20_9BACT|nr:MAG: hypothetical protein COU13_01160 [Candidatus Kaiserbacteria bacterium CG10_big_fil_rev_8_21_14_0_10_43_70]